MTNSLSAILIAKDEEQDLPGCLESLKGLATEIIVVVSADTTDRTEAIARAAGAKVLRRAFDDYARQRQASLDAATGEWCLWIDPDERVVAVITAADVPGRNDIAVVLVTSVCQSVGYSARSW